jgi:hypothetical protein
MRYRQRASVSAISIAWIAELAPFEQKPSKSPGQAETCCDATYGQERSHNQGGPCTEDEMPVLTDERPAEPPFRRLPGVYAGAQPWLTARERRVQDICAFQDFRVLEQPRVTAVHSPEHDS